MSIARAAIDRSLLTWILILACIAGGIWGFFSLGRLEDPAFSIKTAVIITQYPGATAEEVASEVSEPLENAIQQLAEVDHITSSNSPGLSRIKVDVRMTFGPDALPQIWDKLRAKVDDTRPLLPDAARTPMVNDGFGNVFGIFYAVTAPGFSDAELYDLSSFLRREILAVDGVSGIELDGLPDEVIFVEPNPAITRNLGLSPDAIIGAIGQANQVTDTGAAAIDGRQVDLVAPEGLSTTDAIERLTIGKGSAVMSLQDFAEVTRSRSADPNRFIRFDGQEAFTIAIAGRSDLDIVEIGQRVDARLDALMTNIPYGVEFHPIYQQHVVVEEASNAFLLNLAMSVAIVVVVLALAMGWRASIVVGATLLLTVVGTLFFMAQFGIEMQRISLGALIIAMGMLVDNAIVVAEGMQSDMARGRSSREAAEEVAGKTQVPLLGATVIGITAFAGIGLSDDASGEFLFSLFAVVGISLLLSWLFAIVVTPLLGHYLFKRGAADAADPYDTPIFRAYSAFLRAALRLRWLVLAGLIAITALCYMGLARVPQQFFPFSNTPIFFVHYKLPQGADIHRVSDDMVRAEEWLAEREEVVSVATFIGRGASRFLMTYGSEESLESYGHLIIRAETLEQIPGLMAGMEAFGRRELPQGMLRTERLAFGPGGGTPIQARFSGPDPDVLRELAAQAGAAMEGASDQVRDVRNDWYESELVLRPDFATDRAEAAGITREAVSNALKKASEGRVVGTYREGERRIPIVLRTPATDAPRVASLLDETVFSPVAGQYVSISEVVNGFGYEVANTFIQRRDQVYTMTVLAGVPSGTNSAGVFAQLRGAVEAIELPRGYSFEWGGEYESQAQAQEALAGQLPLALIVMVLISILLFGRLRQPLIVWLLVPMAANGVAIGLLATGLPFSFTALLGLLSLSGMLIKNGIVLVEEIDLTRAEESDLDSAIVRASTTRLRPVILAAVTTILGMLPLVWDAFFVSMAVTIMGGLGFASILTLIAAPVFYSIFVGGRGRRTGA